ncbi:hypothetical protein CG719_14665 [Streptomyces sp. CB01373]|nr:hypothetical protein CG719_14665 [Streptomyces sp. CB01373]
MTVAVIGFSVRVVAACVGRPGLALVELSVVEQRYRAVLAVLAGATGRHKSLRLSRLRSRRSAPRRVAAGRLVGFCGAPYGV